MGATKMTPNQEPVERLRDIKICGCTRVCYGHEETYKKIEEFISHQKSLSQAEVLEEIMVSWDIADGGAEWVVQFYKKEKDGKMTLLTQLDKNSDDGGSFSMINLSDTLAVVDELEGEK
jgi:hypothetical protein